MHSFLPASQHVIEATTIVLYGLFAPLESGWENPELDSPIKIMEQNEYRSKHCLVS